MAPFATITDVGDFLGEDLTGARLTQATMALEMATADIQGWTRRRLERVANDVIELEGTLEREIVLPSWPVVAVTTVKVDGVTVPAAEYTRVGRSLWRNSGWGEPGEIVEVTYTHGYSPIPDDIRMATVKLAVRTLQNPQGIRQEGIGSYSVTYGGEDVGGAVGSFLAPLIGRYRVRAASPSLTREPVGSSLPIDI